MFEHLPLITDGNLNTVVEKEIDFFQDLLERSTKLLITQSFSPM